MIWVTRLADSTITVYMPCRQPSTKEVKSTEITVSTTPSINNSSSVDTVPPLQPSPAKKGSVPPHKSASVHAFSGNPLARAPLIKTVRTL